MSTDRRVRRPAPPRGKADLVLVNARVLTLDPAHPRAEAVAVKGDRILALGSEDEIFSMADHQSTVVDAQGGIALPGFHDAHLHLLSYARQRARVDCQGLTSLDGLVERIGARARQSSSRAWICAAGFDEFALDAPALPDRVLLDRATSDHPVRLQHRSLHLDVLNTTALRETGLWSVNHPAIERDSATLEPTGRLYHAAELLRHRLPRPTFAELAADVRAACVKMASYGLTTIQDASVTNGGDEWELFHRLDEGGYLAGLRLFVMPGLTYWRGVAEGRAPTESVRLGPVKVMLSERDSDSETLGTQIAEVHHTGRSVAIHAVSEAELALALGALELRSEGMPRSRPDRIEHGAIIPEALHPDLKHAGVTVVGEPGLVHERGDVYLDEMDSELHEWVHRAGSLLRAGISYAIGSDAPVLEPRPLAHFAAARRRLTRSGKVLGAEEALTTEQALRAMTVEAARSVGAEPELGSLRPGMLADIVVLDRDALEIEALGNQNPVRLTIGAGQILWQRQD